MTSTPTTSSTRSGLDLQWVDAGTRPQDDLFSHVNGRWITTHEIPDDRAQDGAFRVLRDNAEADVRAIVEEAGPGPVADLYASFMDVERIEAAGVAPLTPLLDEAAGAPDRAALAAVLGRRQREGRAALFGAFVSTDAKDSTRYLVHLSQSGLGLPDESYYRDPKFAQGPGSRTRPTSPRSCGGCARIDRAPRGFGRAPSWRWRRRLAAESLGPRHQGRDADADLQQARPRWASCAALGARASTGRPGPEPRSGRPTARSAEVVVRQPSFVTAFAARLWAERPAGAVAGLAGTAQSPSAVRGATSVKDVRRGELRLLRPHPVPGTPELRPRWKRGVSLVEAALGEASGRSTSSGTSPRRQGAHGSPRRRTSWRPTARAISRGSTG
jgi:putative endopeptidase